MCGPCVHQMLIDARAIPPLTRILWHDDMAIRKEALWTIHNCLAGGTLQQCRTLVNRWVRHGALSVRHSAWTVEALFLIASKSSYVVELVVRVDKDLVCLGV